MSEQPKVDLPINKKVLSPHLLKKNRGVAARLKTVGIFPPVEAFGRDDGFSPTGYERNHLSL